MVENGSRCATNGGGEKVLPDASRTPQGHWEWRAAPQYGPRATGPARVRIWVPESRDIASCDCAMMQASAADCMRGAVRSDKG